MPNWKKVIVSGSNASFNSITASNGAVITGSLLVSGSTTQTGNNSLTGNTSLTGSVNISGSTIIFGTTNFSNSSTTITGSLLVSGSTTQTGNNNLFGNTTLSGSIIISGSTTTPTTPTIKIYGDMETDGVIKFLPVSRNIDTSISGSYIYVSGSTQDLYFSQNGQGYTNTSRLRWFESNLYTGLLSGGVISASLGSTSFSITSGSALIVSMGASTSSIDPYPTAKRVFWNNITASLINSGSAKITYVGIDSNGQLVQQIVPWGSTDINQWDTQVELGVILHLSGSVVTGVYNAPQVSYGQSQQTDDFIRAFGPVKISGHTLSPSGSSPTLSIIKTGGTAYNRGANYVNNPNHPSTVVDTAANTSKIYRYYISGSTPVIDTGVNNAGYTEIDNKNYVDTTTGTLATVGASNWSIQRVFWIPNSPTNAFLVYYGNARYGTLLNAINAKDSEPFTEAPNTAANAIFLGYIIIQGGGSGTPARDLNNSNETAIIPGGLFRSIGGVGSSGTSPISTTLEGLADVSVASRATGDLLYYNGSTWNNSKSLTGNYSITGSLNVSSGVTANLTGTASYATQALNASTASYVVNANTASYVLQAVSSSFATNALTASYILNAVSSSYAANADLLDGLNSTVFAQTGSNTFTGAQVVSSSFTVYTGSAIEFQVINTGTKIGNLITDVHTITGSVGISGSVTATGFTGPLTGTASYATQALNASTASYVVTANTASYVLQAVSSSYASNADLLDGINSAAFALTGSTNRFTANQIITGSLTATGDIITQGNLIAQQYIVSSSVSYFTESFSSGSTKFGDTLDDTHQFTGSVSITSSLNVIGGNVGIGTASSTDRLTVSGRINILGAQQNSLWFNQNAGGTSTGFLLGRSYTSTDSQDFFIYDVVAASPRIFINSSGYIGVNTTSPLSLLDVRSGFITAGTGTSTGGSILLQGYYGSGALTTFGSMYSSGGPVIGYGVTPSTTADSSFLSSTVVAISRGAYYMNGGNHVWYSGGTQTVSVGGSVSMTELMRLTSGGNVGIGTTNIGTEANLSLGALGTTEGGQLILQKGTSQASASMLDNFTNQFRILAGTDTVSNREDLTLSHITRNLTIYGDVVAYGSSDKRLKENIQPIENALDKLDNIGGYTFNWNDQEDIHGHKGNDIGVIAQEIEDILPEVVTTRDNGYKAVKYEKIVPLLIQAIKELKAEVDKLKSINK